MDWLILNGVASTEEASVYVRHWTVCRVKGASELKFKIHAGLKLRYWFPYSLYTHLQRSKLGLMPAAERRRHTVERHELQDETRRNSHFSRSKQIRGSRSGLICATLDNQDIKNSSIIALSKGTKNSRTRMWLVVDGWRDILCLIGHGPRFRRLWECLPFLTNNDQFLPHF